MPPFPDLEDNTETIPEAFFESRAEWKMERETNLKYRLPFSSLTEHWIPNWILEFEAERCLDFYEKETGHSAFKENGLGVRIEQVCSFLIEAAGFEVIHTDQILIPDSDKYAAYRDTDSTLWGCTNYNTKEVHLLQVDKENLTHNFAVPHETGHALRGGDEKEANLFARYFTLPSIIFKKRFIELANLHYDSSKHKGSLKYIFCELVRDFQVSGRTCLLRALDLGLIKKETKKMLWYETILPRQ